VARRRKKRNAYRTLVGMPEVKRQLGTLRCRWEDNINIYLRETEFSGMDWINLTE
jgi:hypothetical protein